VDELEKYIKRVDKLESLIEEKNNEIRRVKRARSSLEREIELEREAVRAYQTIENTSLVLPEWILKPSGKEHEATPVQMFSDLHFGEIQPPAEVHNYNAYSDKIAKLRLQQVATSSVKIIREFTAGLTYPGIVLPFGGDLVTGEIHDELTKNNTETVIETVATWTPELAAMIEMFADEFGSVYIPAVMGNHSRRGHSMEHKNQARDSYDWLIMKMLAMYFKKDKRVTIIPSDALELRFSIYKTRFLLTHGYFGGGGGADSYSRVLKSLQRTVNRDRITGNDFDYMLMGHYHTTVFAPGVIQCGSLKGLDVYAHDINVTPEPPSQALFFVTPERGITMRTPVFAQGKEEKRLWKQVTYRRDV
jgi:hypothetical protein